MRIEDRIAQEFRVNQWTWKLKGGETTIPGPEDIEAALDEAARMLYAEPVGTQLEVGRLIIKKTTREHDVYLFCGTYE